MHHVKINGDFGRGCVRFCHLECCLLRRTIDGRESIEEVQCCIVFFDVFHQRWNIFLNPKQHTACIHELDVDVFERTVPEPSIT